MVFSTILTFVVVPALHVLLQGVRERLVGPVPGKSVGRAAA
jgi:hypothetical protein